MNCQMLLSLAVLSLVAGSSSLASVDILPEHLFRDDAKSDISDACRDHLLAFQERIGNFLWSVIRKDDQWAVKMLDAQVRWPDGILEGNLMPMGSYSSCVEVSVGQTDYNNTLLGPFRGRYVSGFVAHTVNASAEELRRTRSLGRSVVVGSPPMANDLRELPIGIIFRTAHCVPSSCSSDEISTLINQHLGQFNTEESFWSVDLRFSEARDDRHQLGAADVAMITLLSIFGIMALLGLATDLLWKKKGSLTRDLLLGFSPYTNLQKLLNTSPPPVTSSDHLTCMNGMRFMSMTWVVMGHTFESFAVQMPINNIMELPGMIGNFWSQALLNGYVCVDSFFFIGGCLVAFLTLKEIDRAKGRFNIFMYYVHRYIRLTGIYGLLLLFRVSLLKYLDSGPNNAVAEEIHACKSSAWRNILYINNFNTKDWDYPQCSPQTWYMAAEMQMFLASPLVLYPMWLITNKLKNNKLHLEYGYLGLWTLAVTIYLISMTAVEGWAATPLLDSTDSYVLMNYFMPWARLQPYLVGIGLGTLLHTQRGKHIEVKPLWVASGWLLATGMAVGVLYGPNVDGRVLTNPGALTSEAENILYGSLHRLGWGLSLAWMVWACVKGYGGYVNRFLCWEAFAPLARLSFVVYLSHDLVINQFAAHVPFPIQFTFLWWVFAVLWVVMATLVFSVPIVVLFEMPLFQLEKFVFGKLLAIGKTNEKK